jgi:WD40 repeat protein
MVYNFNEAISESPPHAYISALAFAPPQSLIFMHHRRVYPHTLIARTPPNDTILPVITTAIAGNIVAAVMGNTWLKVFDLACGGAQMLSVELEQLEVKVDSEHGYPLDILSYSAAISPNKELVALGRNDCRVFNVNNKSVLCMQNENEVQASITYLAFSQDSQRLAAVYDDGTVREWNISSGVVTPYLVWDPETYQQDPRARETFKAVYLIYSEDGLKIVSRSDKIYIWGRNGGCSSSCDRDTISDFLTIGSTVYAVLAHSQGPGYRLHELLSGKVRPEMLYDGYSAASTCSEGLDFIRSPRYLQPRFGWDRLAVSRDYRLVADGSVTMILIYDVKQGKVIASLAGHAWEVVSLSFVELEGHGEYCLFSASRDGTIRLWDLSALLKGESAYTLPTDRRIGYASGGAWITNSEGERLFYLHRSCPFRHPLNSLIIGPCADLDLTHFVYGKEWTRCKDPIDPDEEGSGLRIEDLAIEVVDSNLSIFPPPSV